AARDLGAVEPARYAHLNSLAAEPQRRIHGFSHRSTERHALFQLQCDGLSHQLRIEFRLVYFLNIDEHLALGLLGEVLLELFDLGALAADDNSWTRRPDSNAQLIAGTIHFDRADAGRLQAFAQ